MTKITRPQNITPEVTLLCDMADNFQKWLTDPATTQLPPIKAKCHRCGVELSDLEIEEYRCLQCEKYQSEADDYSTIDAGDEDHTDYQPIPA